MFFNNKKSLLTVVIITISFFMIFPLTKINSNNTTQIDLEVSNKKISNYDESVDNISITSVDSGYLPAIENSSVNETEKIQLLIGYSGDFELNSNEYRWSIEDETSSEYEFNPGYAFTSENTEIRSEPMNQNNDKEMLMTIDSSYLPEGKILDVGSEYIFVLHINGDYETTFQFVYKDQFLQFQIQTLSVIPDKDISNDSVMLEFNYQQPNFDSEYYKVPSIEVTIENISKNNYPSNNLPEPKIIETNNLSGKENIEFIGLDENTPYRISWEYRTNEKSQSIRGSLLFCTEPNPNDFEWWISNKSVSYNTIKFDYNWKNNNENSANIEEIKIELIQNFDYEYDLKLNQIVSSGDTIFSFDITPPTDKNEAGSYNISIYNDNEKSINVDIMDNESNNIDSSIDSSIGNLMSGGQYSLNITTKIEYPYNNDSVVPKSKSFSLDSKKMEYDSNITLKEEISDNSIRGINTNYSWSGNYKNSNDYIGIESIYLELYDITDDPEMNNEISSTLINERDEIYGSEQFIWEDNDNDMDIYDAKDTHTYVVNQKITYDYDYDYDYESAYQIKELESSPPSLAPDNRITIGYDHLGLKTYPITTIGGSFIVPVIVSNANYFETIDDLNWKIEISFTNINKKNSGFLKNQIIASPGSPDEEMILDGIYSISKENGDELKPISINSDDKYLFMFFFSGLPTNNEDVIEVKTTISDGVHNNLTYSETIEFDYSKAYSIDPNSLDVSDSFVKNGKTIFEIQMDINHDPSVNLDIDIGNDVLISESNSLIENKKDINVINEEDYKKYSLENEFGKYSNETMYLSVDNSLYDISSKKDIDFLINNYIVISQSYTIKLPKYGLDYPIKIKDVSSYLIEDIYSFPWWLVITPTVLIFILSIMLIFLLIWYINKNRRFNIIYPLALIASREWLSQIAAYQWNPKVEEYIIISSLSDKKLKKYSEENNIPFIKEMSREERIDYTSLLTEPELIRVKEYIEYKFYIKDENIKVVEKEFIQSTNTNRWMKRVIERIQLQKQIENKNITFENIGFLVKNEFIIKNKYKNFLKKTCDKKNDLLNKFKKGNDQNE